MFEGQRFKEHVENLQNEKMLLTKNVSSLQMMLDDAHGQAHRKVIRDIRSEKEILADETDAAVREKDRSKVRKFLWFTSSKIQARKIKNIDKNVGRHQVCGKKLAGDMFDLKCRR